MNDEIQKLQQELESANAQLRAELMEGQEPSDRSQEAAHYNWLDDQNEKLKSELAAEKAKSKKLVEAVEEYADWRHAPKLEESIAEYKGEK